MAIIGFALGVWALQWLPVLPSAAGRWGLCLLLAGGVLIAWRDGRRHGRAALIERCRAAAGTCWRRRAGVAVLAAGCGFAWAAWLAQGRLDERLPETLAGRDIEVVGVITGLPKRQDDTVRFVLNVEASSVGKAAAENVQPMGAGAAPAVPSRLALSWYPPRRGDTLPPPPLRPGERWRLTVRLKPPHGLANPHGFDYEAWLLERGIGATGYVRAAPASATAAAEVNQRLAAFVPAPMNYVDRARDAVRQRFAASLDGGEAPYLGVLTALAIGDQQGIPQAQWEVFRRTAIAHLVSISGLHVSMVGMLAAALAGWAWCRVPWLLLRVPARQAAACVGVAAAGAYTLMAGMEVPAQRSFIMLAVAATALMLGRESAPSRVWLLALLGVLIFDPWAVLSAGFWLSFGAVGVILYLVAGRGPRHRPKAGHAGWLGRVRTAGWEGARVQLAITVATMPALLCLFDAFSLVSPLANAIAIPLVSGVITPLVLLAMVVPWDGLIGIAHALMAGLMLLLTPLSAWHFAVWQQAAAPFTLVLAASVGVAWWLLPRGTPCRPIGLLALVPLLSWSPPRPAEGAFQVTVLDVGQGTAVHVRTAGHELLYDTGPGYGPAGDAAQRAVLPYLRAVGAVRLDRLVLSHGDDDHAGGVASVFAGLPVRSMLASVLPDHAAGAQAGQYGVVPQRCEAGQRWTWDGVRFEVLHPAAGHTRARRENDNSCVLRIVGRGGAVLLAGDIEAAAERRLLATVRREGDAATAADAAISADVVLVPHHGSKTSSSPAFVTASGARHAVFSVGYLNSFRHPEGRVLARWAAAGASHWRTDRDGAIIVTVDDGGVAVVAQRRARPRYWFPR